MWLQTCLRVLLEYTHSSGSGSDHAFGFLKTGHLGKRSLGLRTTLSIGSILWADMYKVKFYVIGFMPQVLGNAALLLEGRQKVLWSGKHGGKSAVTI